MYGEARQESLNRPKKGPAPSPPERASLAALSRGEFAAMRSTRGRKREDEQSETVAEELPPSDAPAETNVSPVHHLLATGASSASVNSPSRALVAAIPSNTLMRLPSVSDEGVEVDEEGEDPAEIGDGKFIFTNSVGEVKSYLDLSVSTLMGMLKNIAVEVVEKEHELRTSSYQKILHEAAAEHKDKQYVINAGILFSQALEKIVNDEPANMPIIAKLTKDILRHFHDLPAEVEEKKATKKIIEEAIEEKEEAAAEIARKRKRDQRAAKIAACAADAEKSSVARKRSKSRTSEDK